MFAISFSSTDIELSPLFLQSDIGEALVDEYLPDFVALGLRSTCPIQVYFQVFAMKLDYFCIYKIIATANHLAGTAISVLTSQSPHSPQR